MPVELMAAHFSHFMPFLAASTQQALVPAEQVAQLAHLAQLMVEAQLDRKRAPVAARRRAMVFIIVVRPGGVGMTPGRLNIFPKWFRVLLFF